MTTWRVSVEQPDGQRHDVMADTSVDATFGELREELDGLGFDRRQLRLGGVIPSDELPLDRSPLRHGSLFSASPGPDRPGPGWYLVAVAGPDTGAWIRLDGDPMVVGRGDHADLQVHDRALSRVHFRVWLDATGISIEDLGSENGTEVEGQPLEAAARLADGRYLHAGATTFGIVHVDETDLPPGAVEQGPTAPFQRRFRAKLTPLPSSLKHPTPPTERSEASRRPLISFAIPIVTALGMALLTGRYIFLLVIALGPIFFAVDGIRRRKLQNREEAAKAELYEGQRRSLIENLGSARAEELRRDRWAGAPAGLASLLVAVGHQRLWERSTSDADFCQVAIGLHDRPSSIEVDNRPDGAEADDLPLDSHWSAVLRHSLVNDGPLALRGPFDRLRALGRSLVMDVATSQSPNDVKIWLLTDGHAEKDWNPIRWLPHTFLGDAQNRIYSSPAGRAAALSALQSIITERQAAVDHAGAPALPIHVVVVDGASLLDPEELTDLLVDGAALGVVGITLDPDVTPEGSGAEVTLGQFSDEAQFVSRSQARAEGVRSFEMRVDRFEPPARSMAALRPAGSSRDELGGPEQIRLVELLGPDTDRADAERARQRWISGGPTPRVPIGGLGELIVSLDLTKDGPHGLIGGTTRSGKTELLKSLFTALAVANHPDDLSIVIVDFKGGLDYRLLNRLPHVIDLSTNHDVHSFVRTVSLIEAELKRRQKLLDQVGSDGVPNFGAYHVARRSDPGLPPLPRLVVVVDEFSELLSSDVGKERLAALESVTRVGAGLGVHLLLATQNFENQLPSQIAANAGMRICFRVQEPAHSKAVLGSTEAATIPKEQIGRAFLRSHGGRAVEFQGARIAGPRPGKEVAQAPVRARLVPFASVADEPPEPADLDVPAEHTDMFGVIQVLCAAAELDGWIEAAVPWPRALPTDLTMTEVLAVNATGVEAAPSAWPLGLVDEPDLQRQRATGLEPYGSNVLLIGGPEAGLAEVLRAIITGGVVCRGPDSFHLYIIDLLGQGFTPFGEFPHVGGVAERNEPLALRMLRHLAAEVGQRKARLYQLGRSSVSELEDPVAEGFPEVVLVVHGADRLILHSEGDQSPLLPHLLGLLSEAVGTGVRVVMAGPPTVAHHRIGSSISHRLVFRCTDPQDLGGVGVPRDLQGLVIGSGRGVDVATGRLFQVGQVPTDASTPASDVLRALGCRLSECHRDRPGARPQRLVDLPWPLPVALVEHDVPPAEVHQPVALGVNRDRGELEWLDAEEDGPVLFVSGPSRSGRSSALLATAVLMARQGWLTIGLPLSRRSPMATGAFEGPTVQAEDLVRLTDDERPIALFIDDVHKWQADTEALAKLVVGSAPRVVIAAGPPEFFSGRNDFTKAMSARAGLVLSPRKSSDGGALGLGRLEPEQLRDPRPGLGFLVVAGETFPAQVPFIG